nr:hypothetical protein [Plesiocystis pacifica]
MIELSAVEEVERDECLVGRDRAVGVRELLFKLDPKFVCTYDEDEVGMCELTLDPPGPALGWTRLEKIEPSVDTVSAQGLSELEDSLLVLIRVVRIADVDSRRSVDREVEGASDSLDGDRVEHPRAGARAVGVLDLGEQTDDATIEHDRATCVSSLDEGRALVPAARLESQDRAPLLADAGLEDTLGLAAGVRVEAVRAPGSATVDVPGLGEGGGPLTVELVDREYDPVIVGVVRDDIEVGEANGVCAAAEDGDVGAPRDLAVFHPCDESQRSEQPPSLNHEPSADLAPRDDTDDPAAIDGHR